ncbi:MULTISPECIES: MarR family winged helix-turn-helix transcriptional regulator [Sphingomonas]|uniref:MarR family transcriptional regulator n=1 Tax=Sphingomonas molluscorum TaxID=418184 RepID=A0ABU8Q442_9SPHN|nr:MarR family transcriptional regulator [Sphingomonas sp. JUb134]MBM7405385.1 DNA-binding MarR family transcriptional regulator [Sphingomonas sp. JUb134]
MTDVAETLLPLDDQLCYGLYSASMAIQRVYKPLLDQLGLTYPQYLVLNILWREDGQTVGRIAERLALESSTLTPLLKRLEAAGLVQRTRNPEDERQVLVALTPDGRELRTRTGCLAEALLSSSGQRVEELKALNARVRELRDALYAQIGGWNLKPEAPEAAANEQG